MSTVGIIGGVGPLAASYFYQRLLELSGADRDQNFPAAVMVGDHVPSRIAHLLGEGCSPLPVLLQVADRLVAAGARFIAIPSVTTHAYRTEIAESVDVPVLNLLAETAMSLRESEYRSPLFLGTVATVQLGLLEPYLFPDTRMTYPDSAGKSLVGRLIERVKAGEPVDQLRAEFARWINEFVPEDVDSIILGCTELPLINPGADIPFPVVDTTDVLARAVLRAGIEDISHFVPNRSQNMSTAHERQWTVVVNDEEQYSIWAAERELPAGWREVGVTGTKDECLDHIERVWTDMRPLSLRLRAGQEAAA